MKPYIDGQFVETNATGDLHSPFTGERVGQVSMANSELLEKAIQASVKATPVFRKISRFTRSRMCLRIAEEISARRQDFIKLMINEAGKPYLMADVEVSRAIQTFTIAGEECKRFGGDVIPLDTDMSGRPYQEAISYWVSRGPILAITPFNFPLNLVAHKVAPALAVGAPILVKPAPQAPGCTYLLAEIFDKVRKEVSDTRDAVPGAALQVLSCSNDVIAPAVKDARLSILSFTGSGKVGWILQAQAVGKKVALELGGNAAVIVHSDADLARAAARCAFGGFAYAGQSCISVQRIFVQESVATKFTELLLKETTQTKFGDPSLKDTVVGPVIDETAANRISTWLDEARKQGARVLCGGERVKNMISPAVLTDVKPTSSISCEEAFGPIVLVQKYDSFEQALELVNSSRFGLQAGVFTDSSKLQRKAFLELEVGGVVINEVPTYRADQMPYGGVKDSGLGREGLRFAMEEFSERRTLVSWNG
jgi:acyl-CoA reductase-like NAD-dependent aldehyde dehydrogenase